MLRYRRFVIYVLISASAALCEQPPEIAGKIASLLNNSPAVQHGRVGYKFVDLQNGEILAQGNPSTLFTPASNTKLYTTATALVRLGANYTFRTEARSRSPWSPGQTTIDDLLLTGGGDPNLSGRALPYLADEPEGDPLAVFKQLADGIARAGIREIRGDVIGVDSRYPGDAYPDGWTLDDSIYSYGAPISALTLNDNTATIILRPGATGELAEVEASPANSGFVILNEVVTDASNASHILFRRPPGSNELILWGTIGKSVDQWREDFGVVDAELFAAETLTDLLRDRGLVVRGGPRSERHALQDFGASGRAPLPDGTLVTSHESSPLSQVIQVVNKVSQNLHAEMLLREVAFCRTGTGTLEDGVKEREAFLREASVTREGTGFVLADGSGLARQDLTTPDSTVTLLRYMWNRPEREAWLRSLPTGALDGSLQHRFRRMAGAQRVHAKTGSLSHVNALSGYIETQQHGWIAFSIMVNGTGGREAQVREFIDKLCGVFLEL